MTNLSNDAFANRTTLSGFNISAIGNSIGFTGELGEPEHAAVSGILNSAWWSWTAPVGGQVSLDTLGSDYDTSLAVYTGEELNGLAEVASNDDSPEALQSALGFEAIAGETYQIAVDGFADNTGNINLNLNLAPNNDAFANRTALNGLTISAIGTTTGFTGELGEPDHAAVSEDLTSAWWSWLAPASGEVSLDTFGSDFDTSLAIYTGDRLDRLFEVASNDDSADGLQSAVAFDAVAGTTYQIAVDGFAANVGRVDLNLSLAPNNDAFANRTALNGFSLTATGTTLGFTGELGEPDHAAASEGLNSAWWSWTAPTDGQAVLNTLGSDYDTTLAVYIGGSLDTLSEVISNDDAADVLQSAVAFDAVAGETYQIAVDGVSGSAGSVNLSLDLIPSSNDDFAERIALVGSSFSVRGTNVGFTGEADEPDHANASETLNSTWWSWTAPTSGQVSLDTLGSDFDTTLAVYTGGELSSLVEVASNDDSAGVFQSAVTFDAVAGTTYQIAVDGFSEDVGDITLNLDLADDQPSPTVDLILDFDGGAVELGQGYDIPTAAFSGFDFPAFTAFSQGDGGDGNLNEQILQVLAGVREDFADFNVRVIWDDLGTNSPFFDNQDTVVMVVGGSGTAVGEGDIFGVAANVDVPQSTGGPLQSRQDTAFAFRAAHVDIGPNNFSEIRELIDTVSHEAGHTFGLSHSSEQDGEDRQLVTNAGQNQDLDSRFSSEPLDHNPPETGIAYAETDRLNEALGAALVLPDDTQSSQTLPLEPTTFFVGEISLTDAITASGSVDFLGDRDAFRFETADSGAYTITQAAAVDSVLNPVLTLWDDGGDFVALGSGTDSTITFEAAANETYYAVAGSDVDRLGSGAAPVGNIGDYTLTFG